MLHVLMTGWHQHTIGQWLDHFDKDLQSQIHLQAYENLTGSLPIGNYLFTDIERIASSTKRLRWLCDLASRIEQAGGNVINHPDKVLLRHQMYQAIDSEFHSFHPDDDLSELHFPVFVRGEFNHQPASPLIHDLSALKRYLRGTKQVLICEFCDTSEGGLYHKYSSFICNGKIIPRHLIFSEQWIVKEPDVETDDTVEQERCYCCDNPHQSQLKEIFEASHIDYGRIDYSVKDGQLKIWEINTNPNLKPTPSTSNHIRRSLFEASAKLLNQELLKLAQANHHRGEVEIPFSWRNFFERGLRRFH